MRPSIGCMIATPGRASLLRTLLSVKYQDLRDGDDVLVVGDGYHEPTRDLVDMMGPPFRYVATEKTRDWGHSQLNFALTQVRGDYVIYQDDDDVFLPRAWDEIRDVASGKPIIGRVKTPSWGLLWHTPGFSTLLDGHCLVVPNDKKKLGYFGPDYSGDQCYLSTCLKHYEEWTWADRVWTLTRPQWPLDVVLYHVADGVRQYLFYAGEEPVAQLDLTVAGDMVEARVPWYEETISDDGLRQVAEFAAFGAQGSNCRFLVGDDPGLRSVLAQRGFEEHTPEDMHHEWPPNWWPPAPKPSGLVLSDGTPVKDWRDKWGR